MTEELKVVRVNRKMWGRGGCGDSAKLLNQTGCMCILGWVYSAYGAEPDALLDVAHPDDLDEDTKNLLPLPFFTTYVDGERFLVEATIINDDCQYTAVKFRERRLIELFQRVGVQLVFEDGPAAP